MLENSSSHHSFQRFAQEGHLSRIWLLCVDELVSKWKGVRYDGVYFS